MTIHANKRIKLGLLLVLLLLILSGIAAAGLRTQTASAAHLSTIVCTNGPTFNLETADGSRGYRVELRGELTVVDNKITALNLVALGLLLVAPLPFLIFGFAATFEPPEPGRESEWIAWRIGYGCVALVCVGGVLWLAMPRPRGSNRDGGLPERSE